MFNFSKKTQLEKALATGQQPGGNLALSLDSLDNYQVKTARDARAICKALANYPFIGQKIDDGLHLDTPLHALLKLVQNANAQEAYNTLRAECIPQLARIFNMRGQLPPRDSEELTYLLKVFALFGDRLGTECIIAAIREEFNLDHYLWSVTLDCFRSDHEETCYLLEQIGEDFPVNGFLSIAYLDFLNRSALNGDITQHPYCCDRGMLLLRGWLESKDEKHASYAVSAATALPFMTSCERDDLIEIGLNHPNPYVRIEAAWAQAKVGNPRGVELLSQLCWNVTYSQKAQTYLKELGRADAIPAEIDTPNFQAMAEMAEWLAHPMKYGQPPDAIELYDTRQLFWTPTSDLRQVWLFKFRYRADDASAPDRVGIGMVGSVTCALSGVTTAEMPAEDIYALHCCWELQHNNDPRAPKTGSVATGKEILFG